MLNNRKDVLSKVTGRAVYANDIHLPGMVHAKVVRSSIPSGRIVSIDSAQAEKMPGVLCVITAKDVPGVCSQTRERPVLCPGRVRCIGDAVALVVAETRAQADEAAKCVKAVYETLPAMLDPMHALDDDAPLVHETGNQICRWNTLRGDVEEGFRASAHILERDYTTPRVQHVCIETEAAVASFDPFTGETTVQCPVNSPFIVRKTVADTLGIPLTDVRVMLTTIGGSFGGKNYDISMASSRAALAAYLLGRPCKVYLTREESIEEGTKRHPIHAHYKVGFNDDGTLQAMQVRLTLDGGAYTSKTFPVTTRMAIEATGPYCVPNVDTISTSVYTNNVYSDALRGFGSPQVDFCAESLIDEIAEYLGKDPMELRRLNMLRNGSTSAFGEVMENVTLEECADALEKSADLTARKARCEAFNAYHTHIKKGVGVAFLIRGESFGAAGQGIDTASGMISVQQDGSITISSSIAEVGQGGPTMLVNVVHETLGVPREKIRVGRVDTAYCTDAGPTVATRGTLFSGGAVYRAALQVREKLAGYAAQRLGEGALVFKDGQIYEKSNPENAVAFTELVKDVIANSDHLNALGYFAAPPLEYDRETGVGRAYLSYAYGAAAAEVTVDLRTGAVSVDEYFAVHDVGHALDKTEVEGQIRGGVSMGVGYALTEEVDLQNGKIRNLNLESYIVPTALDMPEVTPIILECPSPVGPLGAKGLGEPATCIVAPAITNAVHHACGKRVRDLPADLERIVLGHSMKKD